MSKQLTKQQAMRYSRHVLLSGFDFERQEMLTNSSVLIFGLGGLGCAASQYLAASGVGKLTVVDDDSVELTNLQRQVLHCEATIGRSKVDSAAEALKRINTEVLIETINYRLSGTELHNAIAEHDLVLDCTDNLASRNLVNEACYRLGKPLVSGAAIRMEGQLFNVIPSKKSACYACFSRYFGEQNLSCVESGVLSPLVGIIGANQALEAIKILSDYGKPLINKLKLFDAMENNWMELNVAPQLDCKVCGGKND